MKILLMGMVGMAVVVCGQVSCNPTTFSSGGGTSFRSGSDSNPNPSGTVIPNPNATLDPNATPLGTPTLAPGATPTTTTSGLPTDSGVINPQPCNGSNGKLVNTNGQCPAGMAVYAADDGDMPNVACCPLPANDILLGAVVARVNQCAANEVIVGVSGGQRRGPFNLICQPINPKYSLTASVASCYVGNGAAGGGGATKCGTPDATAQMLVGSSMGIDFCTGYPFGSLFTKLSGADCKRWRHRG